jgi:Fe-S cluster assembly iron-binding protein IscA
LIQINEDAENAIRRIRQENHVPSEAVLRIAPVETAGGIAIGFAFTDSPEEGDRMASSSTGFVVYLAPELAGAFEETVLMTTADVEGVELELRTQADLHDHGGNGDATLPVALAERRG